MDLVGSTALGERLDPEDVRMLQGELFTLVNEEVERFGGVSEKFAGDAVLAVFGVPRTHEDDAERAVRAALAVQTAFGRYADVVRERHGAETGLRVGVSTGEVVTGRDAASRGELMVSGDTVNVAARLQQLAEPGTVLVGERTQRATRRNVAYGEVVELVAKGKDAPVRAWRAIEAIGEVGARGDGRAAPLIGRDDDLALLRLTAARVERERAPQLVTIFGHAGVGKSRLVEELVRGLDSGQAVVGRCVPYGDGITYLPLAQIASDLAGIRDDDDSEVASREAPRVRRAHRFARARRPRPRVPRVDRGARATGPVCRDRRARRRPERPARRVVPLPRGTRTRRALRHGHRRRALGVEPAARPPRARPRRAGERRGPRRLPVPARVRRHPADLGQRATERILDHARAARPADAESLLSALLEGGALSGDVATAILRPADGNPFFVEEMLSMLVEQGALERTNGSWKATRNSRRSTSRTRSTGSSPRASTCCRHPSARRFGAAP